jgi:hypothetical protein
MTVSNVLCLMCGSLVATMFFLLLSYRQTQIDNRLVRHIRRNAYLRGLQDGRDSLYRADG